MKKIASSVYENLRPRQRIVASIEAEARGDETEIRRLSTSCPKTTYRQNEVEYSETMEALMGAALVVECDLRGCALYYLAARRSDPESAHKFMQEISDLRAAWITTVSDMGIDPDAMQKAGPPPSPFFEPIEDLDPDPDHNNVEKIAAELKEIIGL
jgi:hypothetical protein